MPTEAGKAAARAAVRQKMAGRTIEQVADLAKLDPQTFGDFLAGRRWPRLKTLNKIEDALGLTRGTLAATGEEDAVQMVGGTLMTSWEIEASPLADVTEDALLTELWYRVRALQRENEDLRKELAAQEEPAADDETPSPTPLRQYPSLQDKAARNKRDND